MALKPTDGIISAEFVERTHNGRGETGEVGAQWEGGGGRSDTDTQGGIKEEEGKATTIGPQD